MLRGREDEAPTGTLSRSSRLIVPGVLVVVAIGLFLRLWALGRQPDNADEAVVALMARGILHGHFAAFYWGQHYGGGEPYLVALLFGLFGQSFYALGLAPVLLDALATLLVFYLGRRLFGRGVGVGAALMFWIWPEATLWQSTLEYGFRFATLDCGLGASVVALRILGVDEAPSSDGRILGGRVPRRLDAGLLGLLLGLGWWCSPEIAYFAVPIAVLFATRLARRRLRLATGDFVTFAAAAVVGAMPWLWANLRSGFASMRSGPQPDPSLIEHLRVFVAHAFPIAIGVQYYGRGTWLVGSALGPSLEVVAAIVALFFLVWCILERRAALLVLFCVAFPLLYAFSPFTWYWQDARYVTYLPPIASIVFVAAAAELARTAGFVAVTRRALQPLAVASVLAAALACTFAAASLKSPFHPDHVVGSPQQRWTTFSFNPNSFEYHLASDLIHIGVRDAFVGYWLAYPLDFASGGRIAASDVVFVRSPQLLAKVAAGRDPAWIFAARSWPSFHQLVATTRTGLVDPGCAVSGRRCLSADMFERLLHERAIPYRKIVLTDAGVQVVFPSRKVPVAVVKAYLAKVEQARIAKTKRR